ncbi:MAG: NAD(+) synthase [Pseudomonadota bacterium]
MKIALLQINTVAGDLVGNSVRIANAVRKAAAQGAELCVTPELALCGYPPRDLLLREDFLPACRTALEQLSLELADAPPVLVGAPIANPSPVGNPVHNCVVLLQNGKARVATRKVLLPNYDVFDERRYFESGVGCGVVTINGWRLGVSVCEDVWNDKTFWQEHRHYENDPLVELMAGGTDALINLSASPFSLGKQVVRERMLARVAQRYRASVLYANQVGGNDDLVFAGKSIAFDATGTLIARGKAFEEDVVLVDIAQGTGIIEPNPEAPEEQVWQALVLGTKDYVRKCGFKGAVLGLSGGIDSALVAAVACEALGNHAVTGVLMPSPYSSQGSLDDALALAQNLNMHTHTVAIAPLMQSFGDVLATPFSEGKDFLEHASSPEKTHCPDKTCLPEKTYSLDTIGITEENLQSRIRGNLLMAFSNKFGRLLLTTGNKSEISVGYCTIYGDMAGALGVIADVSKTMVFRVCRWLNESRGRELIPTAIIEKAPSAELRPDQKDSDSLPDYDTLDAILERLVELRHAPSAIIAEGFDADVVKRVEALLVRSEFKRRQAATGIRVTERAFGTGWRMPVACKLTMPE